MDLGKRKRSPLLQAKREAEFKVVDEPDSGERDLHKSKDVKLNSLPSGFAFTMVPGLSARFNVGCFGLRDLLSNCVSTVQFNYLIDLEWFYSMMPNKDIPVVFIRGQPGHGDHLQVVSTVYDDIMDVYDVLMDVYDLDATR